MAYIGNTNTTQSFTPAVDFFSGNGSTTAFTLSRPVASVAQVQVVIENVPQKPTDAYTVSSNTITFTSAPPSGTNNIYVYYTSPITQVIQPGQGTVGTTQLVDASVTSAKMSTGAALANIGTGGVTQSYLGTNVAGNGPAFSAYKSSNQTISQNTLTKVTFDTESFDTNNNFASSTFTPTVAGYYQPNGVVHFNGTGGRQYVFAWYLYKNGAAYSRSVVSLAMGTGGESYMSVPSTVIYMNGTTDTMEMYFYEYDYSAGGSMSILSGATYTTFGAYLVRAA